MVINKLGLKARVWVLGALGLALTVPLAAGDQTRMAGLSSGQGQAQGLQTATSQPQRRGQPPRQGSLQRAPGSPWGEWWKDELVKKQIGLGEDKARKIDNIFQDRSRRLQPIIAQVVKEDAELDRLTRERLVDEVTYSLQVARVEDLKRRFRESRTIMLYRILQELTPDQYKKLQALRDERGRSGRGGGSR